MMIEIMSAIKEQAPAKARRLQKTKEFQSYARDLAVEAEAGVKLRNVDPNDMNGLRMAKEIAMHEFIQIAVMDHEEPGEEKSRSQNFSGMTSELTMLQSRANKALSNPNISPDKRKRAEMALKRIARLAAAPRKSTK